MAKKYSGASTSLDDFKQLALLGEGAYSAVYKVQRLADGEIYALKKVKLPSLSDKEKQNALNEVRLLASVQDKFIIAYKEAFFDDQTRCLCIVTECADGGDLMQQIVKCQKERSHLKEVDVWRYLNGMCTGLKALHDMRILHRDLKCANVFLHHESDGMIAKLGDFNVSKVAKRGLCMTQTGTPYYASPEVWRDMPYDAKSDMWSLGCVLYEMVALRPPFRAEDMEGLYRKVLRGQYPRIPPHYSHDLADVVSALLQVNPRHRPSIDQLMQMPALRRHAPDVPQAESPHASDLLNTIKLPKNVIDLSGCLPKPRYDLPKVLSVDQHQVGDYASQLPPSGRGLDLQGPPHDSRHHLDPLPDALDAYLQSATGSPVENVVLNPRKAPQSEAALDRQRERHQCRRLESPGPRATPEQGGPGPGVPRAASQPPQPCRPQREARRPMAVYARPQYELGSQQGAAAQQQPQAPAPKPVASGGLRLPRIFSKG
mmetsp:Transcript_77417/g.227031  ORF Transcript_77417/g.227031 Transcript_77417/m.227031 type:complete len:486 (-) Transcript_77417:168-1625(-)